MRSKDWLFGLFATVTLAAAAAAGCSGDDDTEPSPTTTTETTTSTTTTTTTTTTTNTGGGGGTGGTTTTNTGGFGGGDTCPTAIEVTLAANDTQTLIGDTCQAVDDYISFCNDQGTAPDLVYAITLQTGGVLSLDLDDNLGGGNTAFDGIISLRISQCDTRGAGDSCVDLATENETFSQDLAAGTYYVVIEAGANSAAACGNFSLTAKLETGVCGDGTVNSGSLGEECDPGPVAIPSCYPPGAVDGNGNPIGCTLTPPVPELDTCPGAFQVIDATSTAANHLVLGPYDTCNATADYKQTCVGNNSSGRDHVFWFHANDSGVVHFRVGYDPTLAIPGPACDVPGYCNPDCPTCGLCWVTSLYARKGGCNEAVPNEVACFWDSTFGQLWSEVTVSMTAGEDVWVFVDGYEMDPVFDNGTYYLEGWYE